MKEFLTSNEGMYRMLRTIVQGVIGVLVANLDLLVGYIHIDASLKPVIAAVIMAVLAPVMAEMGKTDEAAK
jgi:multisubunit Na+/H+ antiporter MnhG subunit